MNVATVRETANFTNKTNAVTPYTLGQVLASYATQSYVDTAISQAVIDPSQIDLSAYAKKTDLPKKLSELTNDDNYVQTVGGFIPSNLLPSYVDDVLEYASVSAFPNPGESGKIYVALNTNLTYRWTGSTYTEISKSLALGTTSETAYRGDYGQIAYQHSQSTGNPHGTTLSNLGVEVSATVLNYLDGLNGNIMTKLGEKLDLAGGTMTGYITLHHDPTQKMHAANKDYVDKEINGISIAVTQYVTQVTELASDVDGISQTVDTLADTIVEVENDITGLNQTTSDHTEYISNLQTGVAGISSTVTEMHNSVTVLEATVNQLSVEFDTQNLFVLVDSDSKPISSGTYYMNFICKYQGTEISDYTDITITPTGNHTGVTMTVDKTNKRISFAVSSSTAISDITNDYTLLFQYTAGGFRWEESKKVILSTIEKGEQGPQGDPGTSGTSITSIQEYYYKSTSQSELSGGSWTTVYPGWQSGYYIWTKTKVNYSDLTYDETSPICVQGADGTDGDDGVSITQVDVLYYYSDSATSLTGGSWVTTVPSWVEGKFLWTKSRISYSTGFASETAPMCVTGSTGAPGADGTDGTDGTPIVWQGSMSAPPSNPQYLWAYYDTDDGVSYVWDGTQWQTMAQDGEDGTSFYFHVVYCDNTTTGAGYSTTGGTQEYMGTYSDTDVTDAATFAIATQKGVKWVYIGGQGDENNVVISDTAPSDTDVLWLDTQTGFMKRWVPDSEGSLTGDWEPINDVSDITDDMQATLRDLISATSDLGESLNTYTQSVDETIQTKVNQKADSWGLQFDHYKEIVEGYEGEMNTYITNTKKWIDFIDGTIYLGNKESIFTLQIQNDRIEICYDGTPLSRWNTELFYSKEILARKFVLRDSSWGATGFAFVANSNGSLSFRKIDLTNNEISQTN